MTHIHFRCQSASHFPFSPPSGINIPSCRTSRLRFLPCQESFMLTFLGPRSRYCDGLSRRSFLQIGGLALGGLTLPKLFQAEAQAGTRRSQKSVIMVYLSGGLAHQDTFDLKPNAVPEVRGEFKPIDTNVSGIQIGEHLPRLAANMDKLVLLRSIVGLKDE